MKKLWATFFFTTSAVVAIYIYGYGYIFKAVAKNLGRGSLTPSIDDVDQFPYHVVQNNIPDSWVKDSLYNRIKLSDMLLNELKTTRSSSLLVILNNQIIHEQYWKDHSADSLMNSFSMAKGVLAILVGFAIDDGFLDSENQLLSSIFPHYKQSEYGKFLTLNHLMTMQAAFDWEEEYKHPFSENSKQYFIDDLAEQVFRTQIKSMPGIKYDYQSIAAQLLGLALQKVLHQNLSDYLSEKLWKPLGMESSAKWSTDKMGIEKAFCCIHATARDFAKIGQLIMNEGKWEGKQLISHSYCKKLLTPTAQNQAYCMNIWANDDQVDFKYRFFYGFLGQFIIMIPEKKMVIVKTGLCNHLKVDEKQRPLQVRLLIKELCE